MTTEDRRAQFDERVRSVIQPLQRYLRRRTDARTAQDVLGEVLLVMWRRADDVPDDPLPWCYGVARRTPSGQPSDEKASCVA